MIIFHSAVSSPTDANLLLLYHYFYGKCFSSTSSDIFSQELPCYLHGVKLATFPLYSKGKEDVSAFSQKLLLCGTDFCINASLTVTVSVFSSSVSFIIYPSQTHNLHLFLSFLIFLSLTSFNNPLPWLNCSKKTKTSLEI